jgi:hypothetical protein
MKPITDAEGALSIAKKVLRRLGGNSKKPCSVCGTTDGNHDEHCLYIIAERYVETQETKRNQS